MKMMKLLRMGFLATMMALGLTACGGGSDNDNDNASTASASSSASACPSLAGYQAIQVGMSYPQVVSALGCPGVLDQTAQRDNTTKSYTWGAWAQNYYGNAVYVVFVNGGVTLKSARFNGVAY